MMRSLTAVALCLCASPAFADCPTNLADAANGVYVDFDGYVVRYDRRPDGTVEEVEFDTTDGTGYRYLSHHGVFIHESWEMIFGVMQPASAERITYDVALPGAFTPNMTFSTMSTVQYGNDAPFPEPLTVTTGDVTTQTIGACSMSVLQVTMQAGPANDLYFSNFTYFPDLGFAVFTGGGGAGEAQDYYPPTYIGTEPPMVAAPAPAPAPAPQPATPPVGASK